MKVKLFYIIIPFLILTSCSSSINKNDIKSINPEITLQTNAVFKSAEHIFENDWKLIFRKLDDCQYIIFYTDLKTINTLKDTLLLSDENGYISNPDFINLRFNINYIEETSLDPLKGEKFIINRLKDANRSQGDRFAEAGFDDDKTADDFILNLKKCVKNDSVLAISKMVSYPLNALIKNKTIKITESESFIKEYNVIFNKKVKSSILNQSLADVKASHKGLMIGAGEVWISRVEDKICITSINSY